MKRNMGTVIAAAVASGIVLLAGCASTASAVKMETRPVIVDWQGSAYGTDIPSWAKAALENDWAAVSSLPEYSGKAVKAASNRGKDLDLLRSWVQADAAADISRSVSQSVTTNLGNSLSGNKDSDEATIKITKQAIGIFSGNTISGFEKSREFWVKLRNANGTEEYEYLVLYAIGEENLALQIDRALGKIEAATEAEKSALAEIDRLVKASAMQAGTF